MRVGGEVERKTEIPRKTERNGAKQARHMHTDRKADKRDRQRRQIDNEEAKQRY